MWQTAPNDLNSAFDARFGGKDWRREIARALQSWASVANINLVETGDTALPFDTPGLSQGDPRFGDIRIGGFDFNSTTVLAQTYYPPPDGLTAAGDSQINTAMNWNIRSDYDLYSVMLHEMGLALGMAETPDVGPVMNRSYGGIRSGLAPQDIAGIQAIYGARVPDAFQGLGLGTATTNAVDLTGGLNALGQEVVNGTSLATIGDTEYFRVVAPAAASGLRVAAVASNISLLSPAVTILDASMHPLASGGDASAFEDIATASASGIVPGQVYYVAVTGATHDVFSVGAYQLRLSFEESTPTPVPTPAPMPSPVPTPVPTPTPSPIPSPTPTPIPSPTPTLPPDPTPMPIPVPTPTPPSSTPAPTPSPVSAPADPGPVTTPTIPADRFEPNNSIGQATPLGSIVQSTVSNLTLDTSKDVDIFSFQAARRGIYRATAAGTIVQVLDSSGRPLGQASGTTLVRVARPGLRFFLEISSPNGSPVASYGLSIALQGAVGVSSPPPPRSVHTVRLHGHRQVVPNLLSHPVGPLPLRIKDGNSLSRRS